MFCWKQLVWSVFVWLPNSDSQSLDTPWKNCLSKILPERRLKKAAFTQQFSLTKVLHERHCCRTIFRCFLDLCDSLTTRTTQVDSFVLKVCDVNYAAQCFWAITCDVTSEISITFDNTKNLTKFVDWYRLSVTPYQGKVTWEMYTLDQTNPL